MDFIDRFGCDDVRSKMHKSRRILVFKLDRVKDYGMGELRLDREQVTAALRYYDDHPSEMETLRAQREATLQQLRDQSRAPEA